MSPKSCSAQFIEGLPYNVWKMFFISARSKFLELLCDMCKRYYDRRPHATRKSEPLTPRIRYA
jgi:hypothetical protein